MTFSMPSRYTLSTLPTPNNDLVKIHQVPASTFAVIRFSGFMSDYNYDNNAKKLQNVLTTKVSHTLIIIFVPDITLLGRYRF